jgi:hypothetical protein
MNLASIWTLALQSTVGTETQLDRPELADPVPGTRPADTRPFGDDSSLPADVARGMVAIPNDDGEPDTRPAEQVACNEPAHVEKPSPRRSADERPVQVNIRIRARSPRDDTLQPSGVDDAAGPKDTVRIKWDSDTDGRRGLLQLDLSWPKAREEAPEAEQECGASPDQTAKVYRRIVVELTIRGDGQRPLVHVRALDARTGEWDVLEIGHHRQLEKLGVAVTIEEAGDSLAGSLPETPMDKVTELAEMVLVPQKLIPKLLNHAVTGLAVHGGVPHFAAKLAGNTLEQVVTPLLEPEGIPADVASELEGLTVACDLANGEMTSTVADAALDLLTERLNERLDDAAEKDSGQRK